MVCAKDDAEAAISSHTLNVADGLFTLIRGRACRSRIIIASRGRLPPGILYVGNRAT
jgi:hypothetical protein